MGILKLLSCTFLLSLQSVSCHLENEIRLSPWQFELTIDTDTHTPVAVEIRRPREEWLLAFLVHVLISLLASYEQALCTQLLEHTWERSSVHTNVFGLFCLRRFMPNKKNPEISGDHFGSGSLL